MKKILAAAILIPALVAGFYALRAQHRWANVVNEFTRTEVLLVPIDLSTLETLKAAVEKDGVAANVAGIAPQFTYLTVRIGEKNLTVRPAYTEKHAPVGTLMSADPLGFLRSAADDPKAEGVAINPNVPDAPYTAVLDRDGVLRMIKSLKRRGLDKPAPTVKVQ